MSDFDLTGVGEHDGDTGRALKRMFVTCAPCDRCLPHHLPCHKPNEIDYGKITFKTNSDAVASIRTTSFTWRN